MPKILILLILCALASCQKPAKADKAFIEDVVNFYNKQTSISYDIEYKIKTFDDNDTTKYDATVKLIRIKDTLFGGLFWYDVHNIYRGTEKDTSGSYSKYYDAKHISIVNHKSSKITKFDVLKGQDFPVSGSFDGELINTGYFNPEKLKKRLEADTPINDTIINGKEYVQVKIRYQDEEQNNKIINYYINKQTKFIEKLTFYAELDDQHQYNEWNLNNIKFNKVTKQDLAAGLKNYSNYKTEDYVEPEPVLPLEKGTKAPEFTAELYPANEKMSLSGYNGKIVILDFWYASCHPCALAVPGLNSLQKKYGDKIVVLGANAFDKNSPDKVDAFVKRHKIVYPVVFIESDALEKYHVTGFPMLYVIDKEGIIHYVTVGYEESNEKELDKIINKLL